MCFSSFFGKNLGQKKTFRDYLTFTKVKRSGCQIQTFFISWLNIARFQKSTGRPTFDLFFELFLETENLNFDDYFERIFFP